MDYNGATWGYRDYNKNNTVQHRVTRTVFAVGKYTAIPSVCGEIYLETPQMRHDLSMIGLFMRLVNMLNHRITGKVLNWAYYRARAGTRHHEVHSMLQEYAL